MLAGGFQSEIASLPWPDESFVWTAVSAGLALRREDCSATAVEQQQG